MTEQVQGQAQEGGARVSVSVWTRGRGRPGWRVRVTDAADDGLIDEVVARAVRAYSAVGRELAAQERPFEGAEPPAA